MMRKLTIAVLGCLLASSALASGLSSSGSGLSITPNGVFTTITATGPITTTGSMTVTGAPAANTSSDGLVLQDTTAASSGNQQYSPRLRLTGNGFKSNATSASQPTDWIIENKPVQGSTAASSNLVISDQLNAGGYNVALTLPSGGGLNLASGTYQINGAQIACANLSNGATGCSTATGTSAATIPLNNGNNTFSGNLLFTGTVPSLANGNASVAASSTLGGIFTGKGSVDDLVLQNSSAASICVAATGTTTLNCTGLQVGGNAVLTGNQTITLSGDVTGAGTTAITTTVAKIAGVTVSGTTGTVNSVFSNSPTLVTPTLGIASASNIAVTSATIPANGMYLSGTNILDLSTNSAKSLEIGAAGTVGIGAAAASGTNPTALLVSTANTDNNAVVISSTANTNRGSSINLIGNGATTPSKTIAAFGGYFRILNDAQGGEIFKITDAGNVTLTGTTTGTNADTLCLSAGGVILLQAAACTISQRKLKENFSDVSAEIAINDLMALKPTEFNFIQTKPANGDNNFDRPQYGFIAEDVAEVDPKIAMYENDMKTPKSYRQEAIIALLVKGFQEQQKEIQIATGAFPFHKCFFDLLVCAN